MINKTDENYLKKELYELIKTDESIFDFIQESSLDGLWYWDLETPENEWMNARFWTVLGYNPNEMPHLSSSWQNIINQDDLKLALDNFTKHLENPDFPYDQIVRYTHKNGSIVWIHCRGLAIRNENGKPTRMLGAHHDITALKNSELELKQNTERLSILYNVSQFTKLETDEIFNLALEKSIEFCNSKIGLLAFLNEQETVITIYSWSESVMQICQVKDKSIDFEVTKTGIWGEVIRQRRPLIINNYKEENPLKRGIPQGHVEIQNYLSVPIFDKDKIVAIIAVGNKAGAYNEVDMKELTLLMEGFWNIVKQRNYDQALIKAKEEAEESEARYRGMLTNLEAGVVVHAKDTSIIMCNSRSTELLGLSEEQMKGKVAIDPCWKFIYEDSTIIPLSDYPVMRIIESKRAIRNQILGVCQSSNDVTWLMVNGFPIIKDNEEISEIIISFIDITERKVAEQALIRAKERAEENEIRFKAISEQAMDGISLTDGNGNYIYVNNSFCKMIGYSESELLKMSVFDLKATDEKPYLFDKSKIQGYSSTQNIQLKCNDGSIIYVDINGQKVKTQNEEFVLGVIRNVTERVEYENKLIIAKERAEESELIHRIQSEQIELNNERLESLLRISQYQTNVIQELLDFALSESINLTKSKIGYIYFYNEDKKQFTLNTWSNEVMNECKVMNPQTVYNLDKTGCWGEAVKQRMPIIINDYDAENTLKKGTPQGHIKLEKFLTIPVFFNNKIVAVAGVANKTKDYDNSDIRQLTLLMDNVWKMSEHIRLIDELKKALENAEKSEQKYKSLFTNMMNAFGLHEMIFNENGEPTDYIFLEVNPAWEKLVGITAETVVGKRIKEIMPNIEQSWIDRYGRIIKTGVPEEFIDYNAATHKYYNVFAYKLEGDKFAVVFNDVTDKKQFETELIKAKDKAEESNRLKSAFLQNMSHEVRTPLNAIVGFSQILIKPNVSPEKTASFSKMITIASEQLVRIITDVIEISQVQAKQANVKLLTHPCISFADSILKEQFAIRAQEKGISFEFIKSCICSNVTIYTDLDKLNRIVFHLIDNALKFTQQGSIQVICNLVNSHLEITVIDTGIGISEQMQKVIFEPFRQIETGITRNYGGNGLGLALVKSYVELLKGNITLQSEENKGTIITVSIPIASNYEVVNKQLDKNKKYSVNTILIAEDEINNFEYLKELLFDTGIEIVYAQNGQQAVDICHNNSAIDLILMDIQMPVLDGHQAAQLIRAFRPNITLIAQTAYALENEKEKFINDFDDILIKPISEDSLFQILKKYKDKY